ncbi:MAG: tRNA (guanine(10)-N(2))-dimethyltransferase [Nitrososphaerota archaeon]
MLEDYSKVLGFGVEYREEGLARFLAPKLPSSKNYAPTSLPAFYNPKSKSNRDMTILFLKAFFQDRKISVCEPLAGIGIRTIRMFLETGIIENSVVNDISRNAYELMKINFKLNNIESNVEIKNRDANELLTSLRRRFTYVDIDPAGSPATFLENGFRSCFKKDSVLAATSTDLSALTGSKPTSCFRKYGVYSIKTPFSKEIALRILASFMVKTAARLGLSAEPVLSFIKDHYARVFVKIRYGIERAKKVLKNLGWISYCKVCGNIQTSSIPDPPQLKCVFCNADMLTVGLVWIGELTNRELVSKMLQEALENKQLYGDISKLLQYLVDEDSSMIGYYPVNYLASKLSVNPVKPTHLIEELRKMGYRATHVHMDSSAVKTEAPINIIKDIFKLLSKR